MSTRDKDARAAMDTILWHSLSGEVDALSPVEVAHDAWLYADAMEAERAKRDKAEAPAVRDELPGEEHIGAGASPSRGARRDAELAAARREGRDAGLREAFSAALDIVRKQQWNVVEPGVFNALQEVRDRLWALLHATPADPAPDVAALQAETAKLRAVAEAAASMGRTEIVYEGMTGHNAAEARKSGVIALAAALDGAIPGWRTK